MSYNEPPPPPPPGGSEPPPYGGEPPSYGAPPPPPPGGYGGYGGQPPYGASPQGTNKKAIWALVLGIGSLLCCGLIAGIPAIVLGNMAKKEIDAGNGTGRGLATAGFVLGIIAVALSLIFIVVAISTGGVSFNGDVSTG